MKYKTYKELSSAFQEGELSRDEWFLMVDNDFCRLSYIGPVPAGVDSEEFAEQKYDEGKEMFVGRGYHDLCQVLETLGIPCEHC